MVFEAVDGERDQLDIAPAELWTELSCSAEFSGADRSEVSRMREQDAPADGGNKLSSLMGNGMTVEAHYCHMRENNHALVNYNYDLKS